MPFTCSMTVQHFTYIFHLWGRKKFFYFISAKYFESKCDNDFLLDIWPKIIKRFLCTITAAQAAEKHGDEWDVTLYLWWGTYTSVPTWTHSQNSLAVAEAPSLKISFHRTSLRWYSSVESIGEFFFVRIKNYEKFLDMVISLILIMAVKAHSQIWDNLWQLKAL